AEHCRESDDDSDEQWFEDEPLAAVHELDQRTSLTFTATVVDRDRCAEKQSKRSDGGEGADRPQDPSSSRSASRSCIGEQAAGGDRATADQEDQASVPGPERLGGERDRERPHHE